MKDSFGAVAAFRVSSWAAFCVLKREKKMVNMHFEFLFTRLRFVVFLFQFQFPRFMWSCDALYNTAQVDFNSAEKSCINTSNLNSWIFHANLNVLPEDFIKKATVSSSLSPLFSILQSSPHFAHAICVNQHDTVSLSRKKEAQKEKSCRWVIVMVTYTRYTQNIRHGRERRPFNTVNVRQCSMIWKKAMRLFFSRRYFCSCP